MQIHDLPIGFMPQNVGRLLGNFLGQFLDYDTKNNDGIWRSFMQPRVRIDVRVPLKKENKVKKSGGEWRIVRFKYERLGIFCFACGIIGHTEQYCEKLLAMDNDDGARGWGQEMRVDLKKPGNGGSNRWLREGGCGKQEQAGTNLGGHGGSAGVKSGRAADLGFPTENNVRGDLVVSSIKEQRTNLVSSDLMANHAMAINGHVNFNVGQSLMEVQNYIEDASQAEKKRRRAGAV